MNRSPIWSSRTLNSSMLRELKQSRCLAIPTMAEGSIIQELDPATKGRHRNRLCSRIMQLFAAVPGGGGGGLPSCLPPSRSLIIRSEAPQVAATDGESRSPGQEQEEPTTRSWARRPARGSGERRSLVRRDRHAAWRGVEWRRSGVHSRQAEAAS